MLGTKKPDEKIADALVKALQSNPNARRLYRVWTALPEDQGMTQEEVDDRVIGVLGLAEGDRAGAAHYRLDLARGRAIVFREGLYRRSETFPVPPDTNPGSHDFNAALARSAAEERERLDEEATARQRVYENSPAAIEKKQLREFVSQTVAEALAKNDEKRAAEFESLRGGIVADVLSAIEQDLDQPAKRRLVDALRKRGLRA
jgi:hypothetical protein